MKRLTFTSLIDPITGYGQQAIEIARGLHRHHAHMAIRAIRTWEAWGAKIPKDIQAMFVSGEQPEPWELLMHPPDFAPTPGKRTAFFTMWEATRLPPMGVDFLNRAECVIVPSQWNASCFSANGVNTRIRVVPLGINTDVFKFKVEPDSIKELCVFGAAGRMAHGGKRKGLEEVMEIFSDAFPHEKDVRLKVKCFPDCPIRKPLDKRIELVQAHLTEEQLASWFEHIHCFVSHSRSEGWGLMQHQALATGRPIISIDFGGVREFFREDLGYAVPHTLEPAKFGYLDCGCWAEPDRDAMISEMRDVYAFPASARFAGARAAAHVSRFSHGNMVEKLAKVLKEIGAL